MLMPILGCGPDRGLCPEETEEKFCPCVHLFDPSRFQAKAALRQAKAAMRLIQADLGCLIVGSGWFRPLRC